MSDKNKLFYNERPYIYAFLGIVGFAFAKQSKLALVCGLVLLACSFIVFKLRKRYQIRQAELLKKHGSLTGKLAKDKTRFEVK